MRMTLSPSYESVYVIVLVLGPKTWTRALAKSSVQYSSQYRVLRPHWRDRKADDLIQNCAAAYAGTCQAHIRCTTALRIGTSRKWRTTHLTRRLKKKAFYFWKSGANLDVLAIARLTHASGACVAFKVSWARNSRAINFLNSTALRSEAPATKSSSFRLLVPPLVCYCIGDLIWYIHISQNSQRICLAGWILSMYFSAEN